jgi:metal-responsive CopG/Arc/MetJ family transcriptional regulator
MKTISVKVSDELAARLEREARQRGCIKSDVVRDALKLYLGRNASDQHRRVSALDLAGTLAGCLAGPVDLATNPVHSEGFGG